MKFRTLVAAMAIATLPALPATLGCKKAQTPPAEESPASGAAVTEDNDHGSVSWTVTADGKVKGIAKTTDGKDVSKKAVGFLIWKTSTDEVSFPIGVDKDGVIISYVTPPTEDLTEMRYTIYIEAAEWNGVIFVPKGGTQTLADDGRVAFEKAPPEDKKVGPHGGVVQVVGDDRVELVADKETGQVRVYVLDVDYKPIAVGERRVRLATVADRHEMLDLDVEPGGLYFVGRLSTRVDPVRVTIAVSVGVVTHACVMGWAPGVHLVAPGVTLAAFAAVPRVRIMASVGWGAYVDVRARGRVDVGAGSRVVVRGDDDHHDHGHGHGRGHGHDDDHGGGKVKVQNKVHINEHNKGGGHVDRGGGRSGGGRGKGRR